jgi:hypothetical protein
MTNSNAEQVETPEVNDEPMVSDNESQSGSDAETDTDLDHLTAGFETGSLN